MLSAKRPDMEAPDVRNSYRMDHHIRHWASQARSVGRLLDLDMDTGGPAVLVAVAPHVAPPLASELMHATRAEEIQRRIADDCRWATAGIAREKARHRVLQAILEGFRKELARLLPIVQAEEAKACGDEVRDLSNELEKVDDELTTRKLQLNFTQSDCTALVTSRDRLEAQLSQASKKVTAEEPLVHRFTEEQNRLKAELATAQAALSETETLIVDALHRAGIEEAEFDQARAQQAEDLASAIAAVEKQALDDAQLGGTLETLQAESSMVGAELERTLARHVEQSARRERLQQRLDETQALWRLRQAELKVAMELHKKTTAAAKIELQQIREAEDAATNRRRAAKAEVKGLESKVNEVRDRCTAASKEIDASKARTQKNRRAGEQCEAEMKRIAAEHARAEEAFDAAIKRRKDLEEKLTTIQVEHNQEELRLTNKLQTVEKRHADLQVREAAASGGIAEVEAEMAANTSASQKVMAHLAWEQGAADVMMQDAKVALDEARAKLVTAENDKRVQLEQSATLLALLENEQKVWDKKRSALLAPLHKLEIEITGHEDLIKSMPFRRISCIKATVAAENAIVVAEEMRKKCTTEITALEQKCEVLSNEIEVATAAADGDDHNRFETDNRRETTVEAHAVWKVNAIEETADLGPATTHLVVTNAEVATSYEAWHTVLVAVKELFGSSFKEFMDAHTQMRDTQRLLTTQIRVRNSLRTMYRRADAQKLEQAVLATLNGGASGRDESTMLRRIVGRLAKVTASHT